MGSNCGPRYRLKVQTLAVSENRTIIDLPAGAEVVALEPIAVEPSEEKNKLVVIEWQGRKLKMFAVDLVNRGERTEGAAE
jgi:hypothetical protein